MTLIKCEECGKEISKSAQVCPKCGYKLRRTSRLTWLITIALAIFIIGVFDRPTTPSATETLPLSSNSDSTSNIQTVTTPTPKLPGSQWNYDQYNDEMSKGTIFQARVLSENKVNFDFPYSGLQHGALTLRTHPRYGKDIIFNIERGQFLCTSYDGCTVLVRFDDEEPLKYSATAASDNSTETIFIQNYSKFVGKMLKAKKVRIAANIYQQSAPVFEFDVSGFDQSKYKLKK